MPNGHGGIPYLGTPIFFAIMFAMFASTPFKGQGWLGWVRVAICLLFAALFG